MLIAGEDKRFRYHIGVDVIAIFRAAMHNILGKREGGSTINQQLVRVLTGMNEPTLYRKILEIILAIKVDHYVDKKTIALLYLNKAYYGFNFYNLDKILRKYGCDKYSIFNPKLGAEIVARLKYPEPRNKESFKIKKIKKRVDYLLKLYNKSFYRLVYEY
ncbi:transglycosylase domain-containing protein [Prevotella cerevisiae]|uniref:Transglycosylase domain-containing protein n=2 Tax=Segatella cerevisiae TaxID=2053716 RepID=A0ABT1BXZ8_9BACT|nr:transglycosylase domain-containing protein [Segatella cerevisiae]